MIFRLHSAPSRLVAALALAAGPAAALAQTAVSDSVQLYGTLNPMIDRVVVDHATAGAPAVRPSMLSAAAYSGNGNGGVTRMQGSTSNFGIRGSESLGGGLTAIFQLESRVSFDEPGAAPATNSLFNRNSRVGLAGSFGTVFAGSWDTPNAWSHLATTNGVRNPYTGDSSDIFLTPGFNIPHSVTVDGRGNNPADANFNRRQGNSLQYWSPNWSGFSFRLAYAPNNGEKTAANGAKYTPMVRGLGAEYTSGGLMLRYVYQQQDDYFGLAWIGPNPAANPDAAGSTATSSKDSNHRLIARYAVAPGWTVQGTFDRLTYGADGVAAGRVNRYSRDAYAALVVVRQGAHSAWANIGLARDGDCALSGGGACNTDALGARMWSLGWRYDFSKRTDVFASVYRVTNRANGQYGVFPRSVAGIAPGSRQTGLTVGIEHSF